LDQEFDSAQEQLSEANKKLEDAAKAAADVSLFICVFEKCMFALFSHIYILAANILSSSIDRFHHIVRTNTRKLVSNSYSNKSHFSSRMQTTVFT
jgi:hypothetical protein